MADQQDTSRRIRPSRTGGTERQPSGGRRTDVIRCENCGEDYSVTYKRCPFCDERPGRGGGVSGKRVANSRGGGYGAPVNPIQIIGVVVSLILIITALYIIFTRFAPLLRSGSGSKPAASTSQGSDTSSKPAASAPSSTPSKPAASPSTSKPETPSTSTPAAVLPEAISLTKTDFTLAANESYKLTAAVSPAGVTEPVVWTSADESIAKVAADGTVTNVNDGTARKTTTITAACGDRTATCTVRCNPSGKDATPATAVGRTGVVNSATGLKVRSGPGTEYEKLASVANGDKLTILEDAGNGWYKVEYAPGKTGYVSGQYVQIQPAN